MTTTTTRKPTTEDLEEGYSNLNVEEIQEKIAEILRLDAYADEREDFVEFIRNTLVGRCSWCAIGETKIEKKDHEIYERNIRGMNDCVDYMKSRRVEEIA
jgi:hypothetical protein